MKESDLAELGLPKGARIKLRQSLRDVHARHRRKGNSEDPQLPVSPSGAKAKMSHLTVGTEEESPDSGSPSYAMPSLDSLKSIWNTPTGVATPYGQQLSAPYRQASLDAEQEEKDGEEDEEAIADPNLLNTLVDAIGSTAAAGKGEKTRKPHILNASAAEFVPASRSPVRSQASPLSTPSPMAMKQLNPKLQAVEKLPSISTPRGDSTSPSHEKLPSIS